MTEDSATVIEFTRWFLALFFLAVTAFYTVRITVERLRTGSSPVYFGDFGTLHWVTHALFRVFRLLILGVCLARLWWADLDRFLVTFDALWHPTVLALGVFLLSASFAAAVTVHLYMGADWRSGSRAEDETRLITTGPFKLSRNPIMLCVIAGQLGLFLALPSLFTLVCLILGVWAVAAQVRVEEKLLRQRFGVAYDAYASNTPRWVGLQ